VYVMFSRKYKKGILIRSIWLRSSDQAISSISLFLRIYNDIYFDIEIKEEIGWLIWFLVFNATLKNISAISWRSVLLVEETEVPGENHRLWQTLSQCWIEYHDIAEIFLKVALNTIKQTIKKLLKTQHLSVVLFSVLIIYCACLILLFKH
jgi:hypothetical protein